MDMLAVQEVFNDPWQLNSLQNNYVTYYDRAAPMSFKLYSPSDHRWRQLQCNILQWARCGVEYTLRRSARLLNAENGKKHRFWWAIMQILSRFISILMNFEYLDGGPSRAAFTRTSMNKLLQVWLELISDTFYVYVSPFLTSEEVHEFTHRHVWEAWSSLEKQTFNESDLVNLMFRFGNCFFMLTRNLFVLLNSVIKHFLKRIL